MTQDKNKTPADSKKSNPSTNFQLNLNKSEEEQEIEEKIKEFLFAKDIQELIFPQSFNSYHRQLVHKIADEYGFKHESKGEGKERRIIITKCPKKTEDKKFEKMAKNSEALESNKELDIESSQQQPPKSKKQKERERKNRKRLENLASDVVVEEQEQPKILQNNQFQNYIKER